jgi:hypothetical protein
MRYIKPERAHLHEIFSAHSFFLGDRCMLHVAYFLTGDTKFRSHVCVTLTFGNCISVATETDLQEEY